ncbi:hypothetical protein [Thermobrachium celere]|uniref:hypothetical protein n=1 Tax=Thermobrachium celere TaxID=53422 RepID=UPI001A581199|nr:hypothetical protein TCEA9_15560 [Thermobrachium celere]
MNKQRAASRGVALIPFVIFISIYLGAGIYLQRKGVELAFYQFPAPVAAFIGIVFAFLLLGGEYRRKI